MTELREPTGFDARISQSLATMERALARARKPVILSSFGKDSLCLLALSKELRIEVTVAYFELGAVRRSHQFAQRFITEQQLPVTLLRPHNTLIATGVGGADLAYRFDLANGDSFTIVGATFDDRPHSNLFCGLDANLIRTGRHDPYDWDLIITGRRRADIDPTLGSLEIASDNERLECGTELLMPIVELSDEDVAYFLRMRGCYAPDWDRYEPAGNIIRSRTNSTANPDHAQICIRCLASVKGVAPSCPLSLPKADARHALPIRQDFRSGRVPATVML